MLWLTRSQPGGSLMTQRRAQITGWGKCVPPVKLTNADLELMVDRIDLDAAALGLIGLTEEDVVALFGDTQGGEVLLNFGADTLLLQGITDDTTLSDSLSVV